MLKYWLLSGLFLSLQLLMPNGSTQGLIFRNIRKCYGSMRISMNKMGLTHLIFLPPSFQN